MKVKTLLNAMMYPADIAEIYSADFRLVTTCTLATLEDGYANMIVDKFNIYESDDGAVILEIFLKHFC